MKAYNARRLAGALLASGLLVTQLSACFPLVVAGVGTGVAVATDRRTTSAVLADQEISLRVDNRVSARFGSLAHVNVNSFNRTVLLTGEVADEATKAEAEKIARAAEDVKDVFNELTIGLPSSFGSRSNDVGLAGKIKARLIDDGKVSPLHVKVTVERSAAFLMGMVSRQEAKDAADVVSKTSGIERVVTLFEYQD